MKTSSLTASQKKFIAIAGFCVSELIAAAAAIALALQIFIK